MPFPDIVSRTRPYRYELTDEEFADLQREWYSLAGYAVEIDEYRVDPERRYVRSFAEGEEFADDESPDGLCIPGGFSEEDGFLSVVAEVAGLTGRELQVIEWIAEGNPVTGVEYAGQLGAALGVSPGAARKYKERAVAKLKEHWAMDLEAEGYVDPRYLEPVQDNEFVCNSCHLIYHENQKRGAECRDCKES